MGVATAAAPEPELRRVLGPWQLCVGSERHALPGYFAGWSMIAGYAEPDLVEPAHTGQSDGIPLARGWFGHRLAPAPRKECEI